MSNRTRHIGVRELFLIGCVEEGLLEMIKVSTVELQADLLTKPHGHRSFLRRLMLLSGAFTVGVLGVD